MNELRLHPLYKEAALQISLSKEVFFSDKELAEMLELKLDTQDFQFGKLKLIEGLLDIYNIDFIRAANEDKGKGYKKATNEEKITVTTTRLKRKIYSTARKQRKILSIVDPAALPESVKKEYDAHFIRSGLLQSFLSQTTNKKILTGSVVRIDRPKLIEETQ